MNIIFEWDDNKARSNIKKHDISFEDAKTVFYDEHARLIADPEHSKNEDRYILLGMSIQSSILIVCHCYKEPNDVIRIISARKATRKESHTYRRLTS